LVTLGGGAVRLIAVRNLKEKTLQFPDARDALEVWVAVIRTAAWSSPSDVKGYDNAASILANNRVVFNIRGNKYRLIVGINYEAQIIFVKFFGTHAQYDRIDATTVEEF